MRTALDLVSRLVIIADALSENPNTQISDDALRQLRGEVANGRGQLSETYYLVDYQATCLIECLAELAYARSADDRSRQERALMYINTLRTFLRMDCDDASRRAVTS